MAITGEPPFPNTIRYPCPNAPGLCYCTGACLRPPEQRPTPWDPDISMALIIKSIAREQLDYLRKQRLAAMRPEDV